MSSQNWFGGSAPSTPTTQAMEQDANAKKKQNPFLNLGRAIQVGNQPQHVFDPNLSTDKAAGDLFSTKDLRSIQQDATGVGGLIGAVGGGIIGGIGGLAAGGVGAIPGAIAGASAGAPIGAGLGGLFGNAAGSAADEQALRDQTIHDAPTLKRQANLQAASILAGLVGM